MHGIRGHYVVRFESVQIVNKIGFRTLVVYATREINAKNARSNIIFMVKYVLYITIDIPTTKATGHRNEFECKTNVWVYFRRAYCKTIVFPDSSAVFIVSPVVVMYDKVIRQQ